MNWSRFALLTSTLKQISTQRKVWIESERGWEITNNDDYANEVLQTTLLTIRPKTQKVKEEKNKHH
jgi:hypothetical protein